MCRAPRCAARTSSVTMSANSTKPCRRASWGMDSPKLSATQHPHVHSPRVTLCWCNIGTLRGVPHCPCEPGSVLTNLWIPSPREAATTETQPWPDCRLLLLLRLRPPTAAQQRGGAGGGGAKDVHERAHLWRAGGLIRTLPWCLMVLGRFRVTVCCVTGCCVVLCCVCDRVCLSHSHEHTQHPTTHQHRRHHGEHKRTVSVIVPGIHAGARLYEPLTYWQLQVQACNLRCVRGKGRRCNRDESTWSCTPCCRPPLPSPHAHPTHTPAVLSHCCVLACPRPGLAADRFTMHSPQPPHICGRPSPGGRLD